MGTNWGLNDSLQYTEFEFDSDQAQQSLNPQIFTSDWPLFLLGKPLSNIAALKILEAQIPFSYYVFNHYNNTFLLTESDGGGPRTVTIPVGNYTSATIIPVLVSALNAASANGHTYAVTYNAATQKLEIFSNAGGTNTFTLTFGTDKFDPGWTNPRIWLGFGGGANTSDTTQALPAPYVIQLTGPNYVYINSVVLGAMVKLFLPANYQQGALLAADGPQCAKVPITSQPTGVTFWQDPDPQKYFDMENWTSMAQVDFFLTLGDNPQVVELNGNSFAIKLGILTNSSSHNDFLGGGKQNNRVITRTAPVGYPF